MTPSPNDASNQLWECFKNAFYKNNKGQDGRIRILSIVANKFTHTELEERLGVSNCMKLRIIKYMTQPEIYTIYQVSSKTITRAQLYANTNGPGCPALCKPTITRVRLSKESLDQFTTFLLDKNVTTPSSYKVDAATGLPVMYLKDTKESLWHQYFELHPNGMKRTAFMTRLENSRFIYREDLGGLCLICNEYGFGVFEDMIELVHEKIEGKNAQVC